MAEINTTRFEFGCACLDSDARLCFERRYPKRTIDEYEAEEVCGCSCHNTGDDDCDCYECSDMEIV